MFNKRIVKVYLPGAIIKVGKESTVFQANLLFVLWFTFSNYYSSTTTKILLFFLFVHNATNPSKEKLEPKILLDHFMVYIKGMHYVLENVRKHCWSRLKINRLTIVLTFDGGKGKI